MGRPKGHNWTKQHEYDWKELIAESTSMLLKIAKHYRLKIKTFNEEKVAKIMKDPNQRRLFLKCIEVATAVVLKAMPTKLEGAQNNMIFFLPEKKDEDVKKIPDFENSAPPGSGSSRLEAAPRPADEILTELGV